MLEKLRRKINSQQSLQSLDILVHPGFTHFYRTSARFSDSCYQEIRARWQTRYRSFQHDNGHALLVVSCLHENDPQNRNPNVNEYTELQNLAKEELGSRSGTLPFEFYDRIDPKVLSRFNWEINPDANYFVYGEVFEWCVEGVCRSLIQQMPGSKITKIPELSVSEEQAIQRIRLRI